VALGIAVGTLSTAVMFTPAVQAAEQAKPKISKAVGVPLQAAQKAMAAKQWDTALAELKKAQAVEKRTPVEDYQIDEFYGYIYAQQKKYSQAAVVFERMINSGQMPPDQVDDRTKVVAQMYFQEKDYKKAVELSKKWLEKHPNNEEMSVVLGQSYYLLNDFKNSGTVMSSVVNNLEKAGQTPKENYIQLVLSSYYKQDQTGPGVADALKKMVRYYPKPEYWENLLDIYRRKKSTDRVTLGYYRLMNDVGVLKDRGDFQEASQLAIEAGVPGEAQQIMQKGIESGPLKTDDKTEAGRYDRLLQAAAKQATTDRASLAQQAKDAEKATQGQPDVGLGQAYISYGMYDEAIAAIQRGLKKGGVTDADEAQISLGIAYLKKGQKDQARQAFKAVKPDSKWNELAELWGLRAQAAS
jgi:tetratricopeptide (TPR) repeat protein